MDQSNLIVHAQSQGRCEGSTVQDVRGAGVSPRFTSTRRQDLFLVLLAVLGFIGYRVTEYSTWKYGGAYWQRWSALQAKWEQQDRTGVEKPVDTLPPKRELSILTENVTRWRFWRFVGGLTSFSVLLVTLLCALGWRTTLSVASFLLVLVFAFLSFSAWAIVF